MSKSSFGLLRISRLLILPLAMTLLSCGDEELCEYKDNCPAEATPVTTDTTDTTDTEETDTEQTDSTEADDQLPSLNYLDCSDLDPDKVYLHGTLSEGAGYLDAFADPADPTNFCIGFSIGSTVGIISPQGNYIYEDDLTIYSMVQEPFEGEGGTDGTRMYPDNVTDNDVELHTASAPSCGIANLMLNPSNNDLFFTCPNNTIHTEDTSPYYALGNDSLVAVTSDGSMLIESFGALRLVDSNLNETPITIPSLGPGELNYLAAKLHTDSVTGNESAWLVVSYDSDPLMRWSVDLSTLNVTEEGEFAPLPADINGGNPRLDGNGDLWQTGLDTSIDSLPDVIVYRPIASSAATSEVVYTEEDERNDGDWRTSATPFVQMHASDLVTGP